MMTRSKKAFLRSLNCSPSSSRNEIIQEDITTKLPDEVLMKILSLLPDADTHRMRILSHTWNDKDLWALLPNLHFVMPVCQSKEQEKKFHYTVDRTLARRRRGNLPIQKFFLDCSKKCDYGRVYNWVRSVVECKVQELYLKFPNDRYNVRFCWDLFQTCTMLVVLTLRGVFTLDVPEAELLFPCLKKINLKSIVYSGNQSLTNLISGCPALEELFVERKVVNDNLMIFKISSTSLKRLQISFPPFRLGPYVSMIDAPSLEYLHIMDYRSRVSSFRKPESLVEAHIDVAEVTAELASSLSSAKVLTLSFFSIKTLVHVVHGINVPMFPNVVKLVAGVGFFSHWDKLMTVLNHMPNLEHITLDSRLCTFNILDISWNPPVEVPSCLSSKVKEIIILNEQPIMCLQEFDFIKFLLENSNSVETFRVNVRDFHLGWQNELMNIHRGSNSCNVEIV